MENLISEFEAAQLIKLSPSLLRWFTSYDAKGDGLKLKFELKDGLYHYDRKTLLDFNANLQTPWKKPPTGTRPTIPTGIKDEIKLEAYYMCPVCHTNSGEIAHIEPVNTTLNNHPHNLIFLCPNHHTVYDYGYKFNNIKKRDVRLFKHKLLLFQLIQWGLQSKILDSYLAVIFKINLVKELEEDFLKGIDAEAFQKIFALFVKKIKKIKQQSSTDKGIKEIISSVDTTKFITPKEIAYSYLPTKAKAQAVITQDPDFKACPLCDTHGSTEYFEICPVCEGDGYVNENRFIDLDKYDLEECPLCNGDGYTPEFETCPPCGGEGKLTREQISNIDFDKFDYEPCSICDGDGYTKDFDECPPCQGTGKLTKEQIALIDFEKYEFEDCPLCDGKGSTKEFDPCPPCDGTGRLTNERIRQINFDQYDQQDCPLCNGRGSTKDFDSCPPCDGEGRLTLQQIQNINFDLYEFQECPTCKGKGYTKQDDTCRSCGGEGKLTLQQIQNLY
jgi:DnaJ-class molecular chaperone